MDPRNARNGMRVSGGGWNTTLAASASFSGHTGGSFANILFVAKCRWLSRASAPSSLSLCFFATSSVIQPLRPMYAGDCIAWIGDHQQLGVDTHLERDPPAFVIAKCTCENLLARAPHGVAELSECAPRLQGKPGTIAGRICRARSSLHLIIEWGAPEEYAAPGRLIRVVRALLSGPCARNTLRCRHAARRPLPAKCVSLEP